MNTSRSNPIALLMLTTVALLAAVIAHACYQDSSYNCISTSTTVPCTLVTVGTYAGDYATGQSNGNCPVASVIYGTQCSQINGPTWQLCQVAATTTIYSCSTCSASCYVATIRNYMYANCQTASCANNTCP